MFSPILVTKKGICGQTLHIAYVDLASGHCCRWQTERTCEPWWNKSKQLCHGNVFYWTGTIFYFVIGIINWTRDCFFFGRMQQRCVVALQSERRGKWDSLLWHSVRPEEESPQQTDQKYSPSLSGQSTSSLHSSHKLPVYEFCTLFSSVYLPFFITARLLFYL